MNIYGEIKKLVWYGLATGLIEEEDIIYITNVYLDLFQLEDYEEVEIDYKDIQLEIILGNLLDYAFENGILLENTVEIGRAHV